MFTDFGSLLFALLGFGLAYVVARILAAGWRSRRRKRSEEAARASETRQVRRARDRKQAK